MRPPSPSIPEREFVLNAISQSIRLDGRSLLQGRTPTLTFGPELGWVECAMGKTRVLAYVQGKMVKPQPERPFEGTITIHSEISPMASSEYEQGRPSEEEVSITRMLDKILRRSDAIDKESLCILAGQRVWSLRLTIHALSDSGNLLDCACLAGIVALRHFRRPDVEVIGDEVIVHDPTERAPVPLSINHSPYCFTFVFFPPPKSQSQSDPSENKTLLDPISLESTLSSGTLTIALNAQKEICVLHHHQLGLGVEEVLGVVEVAGGKAGEMDKFVKGALERDWEGRKGGVEVR